MEIFKNFYETIDYCGIKYSNEIVFICAQQIKTHFRGMYLSECIKHSKNKIGQTDDFPLCMSDEDWIKYVKYKQLDYLITYFPNCEFLARVFDLRIHELFKSIQEEPSTEQKDCFNELKDNANVQFIWSASIFISALFDNYIKSNKNKDFMKDLYTINNYK